MTHEFNRDVLIPFSRPFVSGKELSYITQALNSGHLAGDGPFTKHCQTWLETHLGCYKALLTHSGTAALEMAAMLAGIGQGDEVIMPSYTFVSTANAFVTRGGVPVFVDIRSDTLNINEAQIEAAITEKTRAIVPVHYAGVSCEMDAIMAIAENHNLTVIEDAAHGMMAEYKGKALGSMGHLSTLSFHQTKNIISGEGGALLINDPSYFARAEIIREKGTNKSAFLRGEIDKYTWLDIGSSYLPGELIAAFLMAQMEDAKIIMEKHSHIWERYHTSFAILERNGRCRRPIIPDHCRHNAHLYYLLVPNPELRNRIIGALKRKGIQSVFHYLPLHESPAGKKHCRIHGSMNVTEDISNRLLRLPLWIGVEQHLDYIIEQVISELAESDERG